MSMVSAFCPGHVSCIFQPVSSYDAMSSGSRGVGIRLSIGSKACVEPRDDGVVNIWLDDVQSIAHITRMAAQILAPDRGFDIHISNDLPVSQGFGMSASGAIAAAICIADITGQSRTRAFEAAHAAEVMGGGGLGDVSAIVAGRDVPVRTVAGFPPYGTVVNADFSFPSLTLAVLGPTLETDSVIGDSRRVAAIRDASSSAMEDFLADPTRDSLFETSNRFSLDSGLESPAIRRLISALNAKGYGAGMCMLGNSIFTDAPESVVWAILGRGHARTYSCSSSSKEIVLNRRRSRSLVQSEQHVVAADIEQPDAGPAVQPCVRIVHRREGRDIISAFLEVLRIRIVAVRHLQEAVCQASVVRLLRCRDPDLGERSRRYVEVLLHAFVRYDVLLLRHGSEDALLIE
mgnify:FL=1